MKEARIKNVEKKSKIKKKKKQSREMKVSVNVVESCRSFGTAVATVVKQCLHGQHRITNFCLIFLRVKILL